MRLTQEQIKALEPYEQHFTTAIRSKYARYPGMTGVQTIYDIYKTIVKNAPALNASCSSCIFRLLVEVGEMYFKDKQELQSEEKPKRTRKKS